MITDWSKIKDTDYIMTQYSDGSGFNKIIQAKEVYKNDKKAPYDDWSIRRYLVKDETMLNSLHHNTHLKIYHAKKHMIEKLDLAKPKQEYDKWLEEKYKINITPTKVKKDDR